MRELEGDIKHKVGRATKNRDLQAERAIERTGGKMQRKAGEFEKDLEDELEGEDENV
ncbi:MAG: hypothetical protein L0Y58_12550 [Verrucomicrobia subdivision 3 bacterium]|nr:hypothetical protein [Limisphaerales bacterium]